MRMELKEHAPATPPARLDSDAAAHYLGFQPHDIPILVREGLLKPLGHPPANAVKYFALASLEELREEIQWLGKATDAVSRHWHEKNARKSSRHNGHLN